MEGWGKGTPQRSANLSLCVGSEVLLGLITNREPLYKGSQIDMVEIVIWRALSSEESSVGVVHCSWQEEARG